MTRRARIELRRLTSTVVPFFIALSIPCAVPAQTLQSVVERLEDNVVTNELRHIDDMVPCIVSKDAEDTVRFSFEERTGMHLVEFDMLLDSPAESSEAPPRWLRAGAYEDYGFGDALLLGAAPFINPSALETVATAHAIPGHVLLADADDGRRENLVTGLLEGTIAATQYTASGTYELVGPTDRGWPDILQIIRHGHFENGTRAIWRNNRPVVALVTNDVEYDELRFIVLDDYELNSTPVIAWSANANLHDSVREDYSTALYETIAGIGITLGCAPPQ